MIVVGLATLSVASILVPFAQAPLPPGSAAEEYVAKWIGPVLSSFASVIATVFAYLTARDSKKYDAGRQLVEYRLTQAEAENKTCKEDRDKIHAELSRIRDEQDQKFREMWEKMNSGEDMDRRKESKVPSPKRRATDPKTKTHPALPANPVTPEPPK